MAQASCGLRQTERRGQRLRKHLLSAAIAGGTDEYHVLSLRFLHIRLRGRPFGAASAQDLVAWLIVNMPRVEVAVQVVGEQDSVRVLAAGRLL